MSNLSGRDYRLKYDIGNVCWEVLWADLPANVDEEAR